MKSKIMIKGMQYKNTKIGFIPGNWSIVRLSEIADTYSGGTPSRKVKEYWNGNIPWLKSGELNDGFVQNASEKITEAGYRNSSAKFAENGTLLIAMYGATAGKVALVRSKLSINQAICAIKFYKNIYPDFYFYYFIKIRNKLLANRFGGAQPNLNQQIIRNLLIPLPPLPEQKAIAYVLSTIQEAKEKTEKVIQAAKELKKSLMKHLFTYGPVSLDEAKKVKLKESEIGLITENWKVIRLGELIEFSKKPRNLKINKDEKVPFIPMEYISTSDKPARWQIKKYSEIKSSTFVYKGDIILAKITPSFENGKQALLDNLPREFAFSTTEVWAFHAKHNNLHLKFLYNFIKIPEVRRNLSSKMEGTTGRQRLPRHVIENLIIPIPPLLEQHKIASILSTIDQKIESEENKKKALDELFKSMLHNLMTAKIRVNHLNLKGENA